MVAAWMWLGTHQTWWFIAMDEFHAHRTYMLAPHILDLWPMFIGMRRARVDFPIFFFFPLLQFIVKTSFWLCVALRRISLSFGAPEFVSVCVLRAYCWRSRHLSHKYTFFYAHVHRFQYISLAAFVKRYMHFVFACLDKWWKRTTERNKRTKWKKTKFPTLNDLIAFINMLIM